MNDDFNNFIDINLNLIKEGLDIRKLEFRGSDKKILSEEICLSIFNKLISESIIETNFYGKIYLLSNGFEILKYGGWIKFLEEKEKSENIEKKKNEIKEKLEVENLKLQNEIFEYSKSLRDKEEETKTLTSKNLKLQNRQLKMYIFYSIVGGIFGAIVSNLEYILKLLKLKN